MDPEGIIVTIIRKDLTAGIEGQESGSNVCAFSAPYLLGNALATIINVWTDQVAEEGDGAIIIWNDFAMKVSERLQQMETTAKSYEKSRTESVRTPGQGATEEVERGLRRGLVASSRGARLGGGNG